MSGDYLFDMGGNCSFLINGEDVDVSSCGVDLPIMQVQMMMLMMMMMVMVVIILMVMVMVVIILMLMVCARRRSTVSSL